MDSMPRAVYIDLNHWIGLAKARKAGELGLEQRIAKLVHAGKIVVPLSAVHVLEVASILGAQQRQDIADVLREVSRGIVLTPMDAMRYYEVGERVASHFQRPLKLHPAQRAFSKGFFRILGDFSVDFSPWRAIDPEKSAQAEAEVWSALSDDRVLDQMLSLYHPKIPVNGPEHEVMKEGIRLLRSGIADKDLAVAETECLLGLNMEFIKLVDQAIAELGLDWAEVSSNPPRHFWSAEYMESLPTFNVWSKLYLYLGRALSRDITVNDLYDMGHLAVAVPYCDAVVVDKAMAHLLTFRKLAAKYETLVYSNLENAVAELEGSA
jgi:hypothetical protein